MTRTLLLAALFDVVLRLFEPMRVELECEVAGEVFDGRDVSERVSEPLGTEPREGVTLDPDEIGQVEDVLDLLERKSFFEPGGLGQAPHSLHTIQTLGTARRTFELPNSLHRGRNERLAVLGPGHAEMPV